MHEHLLKYFDFERNPLAVRQLAENIWENQNAFFLDEHDRLAQRALGVVLETEDMTNPKNPYTIYKKCQGEKDVSEFDPPYKVIDGQRVALNRATFEARNNNRITFAMLPTGITAQTVTQLFEDLEQWIQGLGDRSRQEVKKYIENSFSFSLPILKQNMTDDAYLARLLLEQGRPNDQAPLQKGYLLCLLQHIQNLPNKRQKEELLSPREEALLGLSASVRGCKAGKAEGIALAYNQLPATDKLSHAKESGNYTVENALAQLDSIVLDLLTSQCSNENDMMRELTGQKDGAINELSHQCLYVKNMIGRLIGLPHALQFDNSTRLLYTVLIEKSPQDLLTIFYEHMKVELFIDALVAKSREDNNLYPLITALLQERLGEVDSSTIWDLDEDGNPTLTKKGALQVWEAAGFIKKEG